MPCAQEVQGRVPRTTSGSDERYPARETCQTPTARLAAREGLGLSPNADLRPSGNRQARPRLAHPAALFPCGLPPNAGVTNPVHIRLNSPSTLTGVDRYFVGANRLFPDQLTAYRRPDTLPLGVATPGCCGRSATPPKRLPLPPCPNRPPPPCVQSRRASLSRPRSSPGLRPPLQSPASPTAASVPPCHTATSGFPGCV